MKNIPHKYINALALTALVILAGCSNSGSSTTPAATTVALQSVAVTPAETTIAIGGTQQFTATGSYSDGTSAAITTGVTWTSSSAAASIIAASGLATGTALGTATVTAKVGAKAGSTTLTVQGPYVKVSAGGSHTSALKANGSLLAWGWNRSGQLGDGSANDRLEPTPVGTSTTWIAVSAGEAHTVALKKDGTAWAWGRNFSGQLGDQSYIDRSLPVKVYEPVVPKGFVVAPWTAISAGSTHTVGRRSDGTIWSWGNNEKGQLGIYPTTLSRTVTTQPTDPILPSSMTTYNATTKVKTITTITTTTKEYFTSTTLSNFISTPPVTVNIPTQITSDLSWISGPDETWVAISAGGTHTLAIRADGALFAWGANAAGQLGLGNRTDSFMVMQVGTDTHWASISAGGSHNLAIKSDGTLWSWGSNSDGQLGFGDSTIVDQATPRQIDPTSTSKWTWISAGLLHSFAIKADSTLWGWGRNIEGQLGNGAVQNVLQPANLP